YIHSAFGRGDRIRPDWAGCLCGWGCNRFRKSRRRWRGWLWLRGNGKFSRRRSGRRFVARKREPIFGWEGNSPEIPRHLELQADLKQLADRSRTLNPYHPPQDRTCGKGGVGVWNLELDCRILRDVMFRLVLAPVTVDHHGRCAFLEGLTERVHTRHGNRHGLHNARAAALLWADVIQWQRLD